jgi:hypothetical protein
MESDDGEGKIAEFSLCNPPSYLAFFQRPGGPLGLVDPISREFPSRIRASDASQA